MGGCAAGAGEREGGRDGVRAETGVAVLNPAHVYGGDIAYFIPLLRPSCDRGAVQHGWRVASLADALHDRIQTTRSQTPRALPARAEGTPPTTALLHNNVTIRKQYTHDTYDNRTDKVQYGGGRGLVGISVTYLVAGRHQNNNQASRARTSCFSDKSAGEVGHPSSTPVENVPTLQAGVNWLTSPNRT